MKDFESVIRQYSPYEVIKMIYTISRNAYENDKPEILKVPLLFKENSITVKGFTNLPIWDIPGIAYNSICLSNVYRNKTVDASNIGEIIASYNEYKSANDKDKVDEIKEYKFSQIAQFMFGMMSEQELYNDYYWIQESFNRFYHILIASEHISRELTLPIETIVERQVGVSAEDLCKAYIALDAICYKDSEPLISSRMKSFHNMENIIRKVVEYYSINYSEIKDGQRGASSLKGKIFYGKPFIKFDERVHTTIAVSCPLIMFLLANGLYWCVRNYYYEQKSQEFLNEFGVMFEDYLGEISGKLLDYDEYKRLNHGNEKIADFRYEFDNIVMLVEQKSALIPIRGKQQLPDMDEVKNYLSKTIDEAYEQLVETEKREDTLKPIIKVILMYENIYNTQLIQLGKPEIFDNDKNCYVVSISEFEQFLQLRKNDINLFNKVESILMNPNGKRQSFHEILDEAGVEGKQSIFTGDMDYFIQMGKRICRGS